MFEVVLCLKQKKAYEMRISDWSSDVCSSDLRCGLALFLLCLGDLESLGRFGRLGRFGGLLWFGGNNFQTSLRFALAKSAQRGDCRNLRCTRHGLLDFPVIDRLAADRSEEHTSELQSLMRISYAVFCFKNNTTKKQS